MGSSWQIGSIIAKMGLEADSFRKGLKQMVSLTKKAGKTISGIFSGIKKVVSALLSPIKALASLKGLIAGLAMYRLTGLVTDTEQLSIAFRNLQSSIGELAGTTMKRLREATRGTVSDMELMRAANNAVMLGVGKTADDFGLLAEAGRRLGKAVGRDALEGFND